MQNMKSGPYLILYTKIKIKWIKDLNVSTKMIKFSQKTHRGNLQDLVFYNDLSDMTSKVQAIRAR